MNYLSDPPDGLLYARPVEGLVSLVEVDAVKLDNNNSNAGGWAVLGLLVAIAVIELWLIGTGRPTISQWVQRATRGRRWWKAFGVIAIGLMLWHLFEGGPL